MMIMDEEQNEFSLDIRFVRMWSIVSLLKQGFCHRATTGRTMHPGTASMNVLFNHTGLVTKSHRITYDSS